MIFRDKAITDCHRIPALGETPAWQHRVTAPSTLASADCHAHAPVTGQTQPVVYHYRRCPEPGPLSHCRYVHGRIGSRSNAPLGQHLRRRYSADTVVSHATRLQPPQHHVDHVAGKAPHNLVRRAHDHATMVLDGTLGFHTEISFRSQKNRVARAPHLFNSAAIVRQAARRVHPLRDKLADVCHLQRSTRSIAGTYKPA